LKVLLEKAQMRVLEKWRTSWASTDNTWNTNQGFVERAPFPPPRHHTISTSSWLTGNTVTRKAEKVHFSSAPIKIDVVCMKNIFYRRKHVEIENTATTPCWRFNRLREVVRWLEQMPSCED
jgi:hypothetical protein